MDTVSAMDIRRGLGKLLSRAELRGEEFLVEKGGKPVAVIVPYKKIQLIKQRSWEKMRQLLGKKPQHNLSDTAAEKLADEAIRYSRSTK